MNAPDQDPAKVGDVVGNGYQVEAVLGRGASGVVFRARKGDGSPLALKIIHPELCHTRQIFGRYRREASILRRIGDDHVVRFLDFFEHDGLLTIALELAGGQSLEELIGSAEGAKPPLPIDDAIEIVLQILAGLEAAHAAAVVHRDLKPANVMVERKDGLMFVRILDFGLAKIVHGEHMVTGLTERDMIFGTPEYMAPEQARGDDVDVRCDVYACGVILYELLTGTVPLRGRTPLATMTAQLSEAIEPPRKRAPERNIPPALEAVVMRALEKDPDKRYPSAADLRHALLAALERRVISVNPRDDVDVGARDTELMLRRSQIQSATRLLADAERLAEAKAKRVEAPPAAEPATKGAWLWPVIAIGAICLCVVLGVLLALK